MIELKDVTRKYGDLVALDSLTLSIGEGEVFGFIGPNGAGKSTTMKILACLLRPSGGSASVAGHDVLSDGDLIRRIVGYMPDFLGVYDDLTVDEYLQFFAAAFRIPAGKRRATVDGVLELTDLREKRDAMVDSLSRGMQQRLGVARVLIHDPKVLLLDEPASGLDPRARIEMRSLLTELARMGKTIMISSHILSELAEMCTSIGIIERGKLLYAGSIAEAYARTHAGERIAVTLEEGSGGGVGGGGGAGGVGGGGATRAQVEAALLRVGAVASVSADPERPEQMIIELAPGVRSHHEVLAALVGAGARVASFAPRQVKLEDAFLRLTKGALN